jgi:Bacterial mobilisation protein (MobC)
VSKDAFIICRVTGEMKALVRELATRDGITESRLVKELLSTVLRTSTLDELPTPSPPEDVSRDARLNLRLTLEDRMLLRERAAARDMPAATYASVLIRSHLRHAVPLPKEELAALKRSVAELNAIGRNLNQIARAANQGDRVATSGRQDLALMLKVAEGLRDHVKSLLKANEATWRGRAEASH